MDSQRKRFALRILTITTLCSAVLTAIPYPSAQELSIFGYKAICPFSPVSTLIMLYISATAHRYLASRKV